jgi:DNA mismatch repair ATPase MutL
MKPQGRDEWKVILELMRMLRVFTPQQRWSLWQHGKTLEEFAKAAQSKRGA